MKGNTSRSITVAPITGATQRVLGPNPKRTALIFSPPIGVASYAVTFGEDATIGGGILIPATTQPLIVDRRILGDRIMQSVHLIGAVAGTSVNIQECYDE